MHLIFPAPIYAVYVLVYAYVWYVYCCIHFSVCLSIHACELCVYTVYVSRYYSVNVSYVLCLYYVYPSVFPSVPPLISRHVCFVCMLCMHTVYVSTYYTLLYTICMLRMYTVNGNYTFIYMCTIYIHQSVHPSFHTFVFRQTFIVQNASEHQNLHAKIRRQFLYFSKSFQEKEPLKLSVLEHLKIKDFLCHQPWWGQE